MSTGRKAMAAAMVLMMASFGCSTFNWGNSSETEDDILVDPLDVDAGIPAAEGRFGIPVPSCLTFIRTSSFTFENDDVRIGRLVYEGKADLSDVVQFFLEEMPGDGWIPGNVIEHEGVRVRFSNPSAGEEIEVSARQGSWGKVIVSVLLVPTGPNRIRGL